LQEFELEVQESLASKVKVGSIVLDQNAQVLSMNVAAQLLIQERDGLFVEQGRLHCTHSESSRILDATLDSMIEAVRKGVQISDALLKIQRDRGHEWSVLCRPVMSWVALDSDAFPTIQLLVRNSGQAVDIATETLLRLFPFTNAEANLLVNLVKGQRLYDAAASLGISKFTARSQLAALFAKTGCHRQPDLVRLILNTVNGAWPPADTPSASSRKRATAREERESRRLPARIQ
jgi:DNA-binding CsgD family transcriptional regulator